MEASTEFAIAGQSKPRQGRLAIAQHAVLGQLARGGTVPHGTVEIFPSSQYKLSIRYTTYITIDRKNYACYAMLDAVRTATPLFDGIYL